MKLWGYRLSPMDFGWTHLKGIDEYVEQMVEEMRSVDDLGNVEYGGGVMSSVVEFNTLIGEAEKFAEARLGCLGEARRDGVQGETNIMCLPPRDNATPELAFIWKLDNNGDTIVVSTAPVDYLLEFADAIAYPDEEWKRLEQLCVLFERLVEVQAEEAERRAKVSTLKISSKGI